MKVKWDREGGNKGGRREEEGEVDKLNRGITTIGTTKALRRMKKGKAAGEDGQ